MEQVVMLQATAQVTMLVHGTEAINEPEVLEDIEKAMNQTAAQFIVCARREPGTLPPWMATVHRLDVSFDRVRVVYTDLTDDPTE